MRGEHTFDTARRIVDQPAQGAGQGAHDANAFVSAGFHLDKNVAIVAKPGVGDLLVIADVQDFAAIRPVRCRVDTTNYREAIKNKVTRQCPARSRRFRCHA